MDTTKKSQVIVGAFLFFGVGVILVTIFMLGADQAFFKSYSRLTARFENVQGLAKGSVVSLSGIIVGNVENIDFIQTEKAPSVVLKIESKYLPRLTKGSLAEIRTQGALGDKFIYIIPGPHDGEPLGEGGSLDVTRPTDIMTIFSERGKETEKIFDTINEIHLLVKSINQEGRLEKIMANLSEASENLNVTSVSAKKITTGLAAGSPEARLNRSLAKFESIVNKIDNGTGSLGQLINDPSVHERLKTLLGAGQRKNAVKSLLRTSIEKGE